MRSVVSRLYRLPIRALTAAWPPFSRLILASDRVGWVLDWEVRELRRTALRLGLRVVTSPWVHSSTPQSVFFASQFFLTDSEAWLNWPHRIGFAYFHGRPDSGERAFDRVFQALSRHHERVSRVQVSHTAMFNTVLESGIDPSKVFLIPIGINLDYFAFRDQGLRRQQRARLEIPESAFLVGSFQKDGIGWGRGMQPKLVKGPDIFLKTIAGLKDAIPHLMVLLTGPARGYLKAGLEKLEVPYRHVYPKKYPQIGRLFPALDLYLVSSRQEGGPKAVLEAMASGVPLVTTRVGQAMDLVRHGQNAWMVDVEDVEGLAHWSRYVHEHQGPALDPVLQAGRVTAEENSYEAQTPRWSDFMDGFVEWEK